ncbi:MAG: hypothetical protein KJ709_00140, partial [Nanoarchaeota archaeon]|nr:hypothetical protein [Nanoarchaeota archaeon]
IDIASIQEGMMGISQDPTPEQLAFTDSALKGMTLFFSSLVVFIVLMWLVSSSSFYFASKFVQKRKFAWRHMLKFNLLSLVWAILFFMLTWIGFVVIRSVIPVTILVLLFMHIYFVFAYTYDGRKVKKSISQAFRLAIGRIYRYFVPWVLMFAVLSLISLPFTLMGGFLEALILVPFTLWLGWIGHYLKLLS